MSQPINTSGNLRPEFRALIFYVLAFLVLMVSQTLIKLTRFQSGAAYQVLVYPLEAIGIYFVSAALFRWFDLESLAALGLHWKNGIRLGWAGAICGVLSIDIVFALVWWPAGAHSSLEVHPGAILSRSFLWSGLTFFFAAAVEEMAFRGYPFLALCQSLGRWGAMICLSIFFVGVHPGFYHSPVAMLSVFLGGIFFTQLFMLGGSLWLPIGFHCGWNVAQALIFPLPGQGRTLVSATNFNPANRGMTLGVEQSPWAAAVLLLFTVCTGVVMRKRSRVESKTTL